ncbi:alkaline phosphatase D family protein [Aerolutibacter ruishenii]|uniref:Alkaline phosphatase D n=1 Tax=Aerolutibacter ruishenii TaxID=686800 RepID=A0A562LVK0_9GAMM|nr:alkaline phosphatase D family protein [Lysobacter ruishenii]TWI11665.1 alkaline phosphatase D [Lysobacter ruishenii]
MPLTRRRFLGTLVLGAAALSLPQGAQATRIGPRGPITVDRSRFPQSVASGDPRPDRVLLWTRVWTRQAREPLLLQVATDAGFTGAMVEMELHALKAHDHCVRVRLTGLAPGQELHYRFVLGNATDGWTGSPVGRTRSAPAPDADVPLRFAFMSCQDYGGRWYNAMLPLLEQELDFILHLGDFIYETVGDPGFQSRDAGRSITFDDQAGALRLGTPDAPYFAARSLDNYRQIHRTVRTDPVLQQLLERAPLVAIWDDHEFADDCWQATSTHHDGRHDEADADRRRNAEQAYFEYLPVDVDLGAPDDSAHVQPGALFPNASLWRRLRFGRNLDLFLTDTRSERPDHLIPEDAFPGTVLHSREELHERLPQVGLAPTALDHVMAPWFDLDREDRAPLRKALQRALGAACRREGLDRKRARQYADDATRGRVAWPAINAVLARWNQATPGFLHADIPAVETADGTGLAWLCLGKTRLFDSIGSRYFVLAEVYDALAALRARDTPPAPMSARQWQWLGKGMEGSAAQWKVVATSISLSPIVLDLSAAELGAPEAMRRRFLLNVDQWDGFPQARQALLEGPFARAGNVVALSGDIHAAFVSQHGPRISEFTVPAVSSTPLADILGAEAARDPATREVGERLVSGLDALIAAGASQVRHVRTRVHGVCLAHVDAGGFKVELLTLPPDTCRQRLYDAPSSLDARLQRQVFHVAASDGQVRAL